MSLHARIAEVLGDFAACERRTEAVRLQKAREENPRRIRLCEACQKAPVIDAGLCPSCLDIAAGACRVAAKRFA